MATQKHKSESVMENARKSFDSSGLSLEELGRRMGYEEGTARRAAWQVLKRTTDPRLSMLYRFANALDIPIEELVRQTRPSD
jgi:transcriptional regulator with XRE-family HTH domain